MRFDQELPTRPVRTLSPVGQLFLRDGAKGFQRFIGIVIGFIASLLIWWLLSVWTPSYLLPGPKAVAITFFKLVTSQGLGSDILATSWTALAGLAISAIVAWILAIVFILFRPIESTAYPVVIAMRSIPAVAAAPILVIWLGTSTLMKLVVAAFVTFFPILVYVLHGLRGPSPEYLEQFAVWAASKKQILWHLRIPWALPSFFAALRVAATYALTGSFVAEMMGAQSGLGRMVITAYYHFDTPTVMVGIICFALLGLTLFALASAAERFIIKRMPVLI